LIEKGKISAFQMAAMLYSMPVATGIVLLPAITGKLAGRDLWLSPVVASLAGFLLVLIGYRLNKLYPNQSIMQYSISIAGRIPGKALGLVYLLFYWLLGGAVVRQYGEFIAGNFFFKTPMIVIMGVTVFACALAVRGGVEVLGRCSQSFIMLLVAMIAAVTALLIPEMKPGHMLPVMENGFFPVLKGSFSPIDWFSSYFAIFFLLPFLNDGEKGMKWGSISVVAVLLTMIATNLTALFLFGDITATLTYPLMVAVRQISMVGFIEHVEAVVMSIWILGAVVQISMHYYVLVLGTAQWLGLDNYRQLVFPAGFLLLLMSMWAAPDLQQLSYYLGTSFVFYAIAVRLVIPLLLFAVASVRSRRG